MDPENRKFVVKHGGVRALLRIKGEDDAGQALAQRHELLQFEAAMGLTNLLTLGEEAVKRCVQADGWYRLLDLIGGDDGNPMLARAGLEGLCNLTQSTEIRDRIRKGNLKTDLMIILAYIR